MIDVSTAGSGKKLELICLITFEDSNAVSQHCHQNNYTNKGIQTFFLLSISFAPQSGVKGYRRPNRRLFCRYFNVNEKTSTKYYNQSMACSTGARFSEMKIVYKYFAIVFI